MSITLTLGWWILPVIVTVFGFVGFFIWVKREPPAGNYSIIIRPLIAIPAWVILSLSAWLVWSLMS